MAGEEIFLGLGLIIGLGISMQWIARILKVPGILLLLPAGMIVGPVLGLVRPLEIFGASLFPLVTIGVGLLLLKGGLELRLWDLHPPVRTSVRRLITIGAVVTLVIGAAAALVLFGVSLQFAFLLSALLVVSGPTVVGPILSYARPKEPVGSVLLWEGIVIDPIGAAISVAAISVIIKSQNPNPILDLVLTAVAGVALGVAAAVVYNLTDRTRVMPKELRAIVALMLGIVVVAVGELIFAEAGLFAALTMGLVLANDRLTPLESVRTLTETIEPLIIGILFIMLAALVDLSAMAQYLLPALALTAIYVLIARPLVAIVATHGLEYTRAQRLFIGALHPRGIVAAATASLFALSLANAGERFPAMVPTVFIVILALVVIYGLGTPALARRLQLAEPDPMGVAIYGEEGWAYDLAAALHRAGTTVMLITHDRALHDPSHAGPAPYEIYTSALADLGDDEVVDDAHWFKQKIKWLIVGSSNKDTVRLASDAFSDSIGPENTIVLGTAQTIRHHTVFRRKIDVLAKTPFGLFGGEEDEVLGTLERGGHFTVITNVEQPNNGGTPEGTRPFLRVNSDGTLAIPGSDVPLAAGESLIVVSDVQNVP